MKTKCGRYFCSAFTGHTGEKSWCHPRAGEKFCGWHRCPLGKCKKTNGQKGEFNV